MFEDKRPFGVRPFGIALDPDEYLLIRRAPDATHLGDEIRAWYDEVSAR